ncbi:cytochrome [Achromobacter mucicolens]|uniref:Cytochrome n=1 Tax=Achromobacter mucicolens TaxID=1389922 RepID=A0ABD4YXM4_9BURK|nr:cytochrome [Achromobacter mucicolens]MDH1179916.1 cytochrome [Achromobacter mucicolens]
MPPAHPLAAVTHPDPYPYYAQLARERPLYRDTALGMWIASHPDTIATILRHPGAQVRPADEPVPRGLCPGPAGDLFGRFVRMNDGAAHARLKPLLTGFIAHRASEPLQAHHEGPLPRLPLQPAVPASQDWLAAAPHDPAAVDRYLYTAPVHAQAAFLGLSKAVHADCAADIAAFLSALPADAGADRTSAGHAAAARLQACMQAHLAGPEATPALRALHADALQAGITPEQLAANLAGLLFQSCEAGAGLLGNALIMAGRRGAACVQTREDALRLIDDTVRRDPPLHNTRRFMAAPLDVGGQRIEAGQTVLLVLAAAAMIEPEAGWIFGAHRHACPGASLARSHAADALLHVLRQGMDPAPLAARFRHRPLPNARVPQFDFPEDHNR